MQTQLGQTPQVVVGGQPASFQNNQQPQIIIINNVKENDIQLRTYKCTRSKTLGIIQICAGVLAIVFNIGAAVISYSHWWVMSTGWWGSPFFILAGSFGVLSARLRRRTLIDCTMAFSILSCLIVVPLIAQCALSIQDRYYWSGGKNKQGHMAVNSLLLIVALVEMPVALYQSILCCGATSKCCREESTWQVQQPNQAQFIYYNPSTVTNQQQLQMQEIPQQQAATQQQYIQQPIQQQQYVHQQMPQQMPQQQQQQEYVQQPYLPQAGASAMASMPSGRPGTSAGLYSGPIGAEGIDLPPAYEEIETQQRSFDMDAKVNDWAQRELELGKR